MSGPCNWSRGQVWIVDFDPTIGHEQAKVRPALVLSVERLRVSGGAMVTVVPITSGGRSDLPARVPMAPGEGGLPIPGYVIAEQVRTVSTQRLRRFMGRASGRTVDRVARVVKELLGIE